MSRLQELLDASASDNSAIVDDTFVTCETCGAENSSSVTVCESCGGKTKLISISEYGSKLPVGIPREEGNKAVSLDKHFEIVPLTWSIERIIGREWMKRKTSTLGEYIGIILANTVKSVGKNDITGFNINHRLDIINNMFVPDVLYMYAFLRILSMGKELRLNNLKCVNSMCGHKFGYSADVSTINVITIDSVSDLEREVKLEYGFTMMGDHRDTLIIRPALWRSFSEKGVGLSEYDMFEAMFINSIAEIKGIPRGAVMTVQDLETMSKVDLEICREAGNNFMVGPIFSIEGNCPLCNEKFYFGIDWSYQNFFGRSFTSRPKRN